MPRRVHNIEFMITMYDARALGQNRDASLLLQVIAVHGPLTRKTDACLLKQAVDQCGLAVIYVSDNRQVANLLNVFTFKYLNGLLH